jgi:nitrate reductase NapD
MNLSAILVITAPSEIAATIGQLEELPGVEAHHSDPATGRIIVTLEAPTVRDEVDGLKRIQDLPRVVMAEMVEHHFENDQETLSSLPAGLSEGLSRIPAFLNEDATSHSTNRDRGGE